MQLPSSGSNVKVDGDFAPSDFKIEISAHAFSVLSKGLYSNPYRAIVRELSCNAWDAHVSAGTTDRPFELFLPNALAPVFRIRDYGTGLSEEGIREVYTTYFRSTKQSSDEQTGCFGLGSKSPYAYTQKFTIISYFNGTKFHYNAIINEKGFPQILKMAESVTTEPNGLELSFSVEDGDFYDFENAARVVLRPFTVKPIVKGRSYFTPNTYPEDSLLEGKGWRLYRHLEGGNICAMGNVEYPIEATRSGFSPNAKKVLALSMIVDFPLGSFEMTPSRESIQWTEYSVNKINDRLEQIYEEIVDSVSKKIEDSATFWEATIASYKMFYGTSLKALNIIPIWKNQTVKQTVQIPGDKGITLHKYSAVSKRHSSKSVSRYSVAKSKTLHIEPMDTVFYLDDFPGSENRLGNLVRDSFTSGQHCYLLTVTDKAALKLFLHTLGMSEKSLVLASTIPKRERAASSYVGGAGRRSRLTGSKARAFQFDTTAYAHQASDRYWKEAEIDLDEPDLGVYVELSHWNPVDSQLGSKASVLKDIISHLDILGLNLPDGGLVGIKTAHKDKFQEHENWKTLDSYVQDKLFGMWCSDSELRVAYEFFQKSSHHEKDDVSFIMALAKRLEAQKTLENTSYISRFAGSFDKLYKQRNKVESFERLTFVLSETLSLVLPHGIAYSPVYSTRVFTQYPLLRIIQRGQGYSYNKGKADDKADDKAVADYLRMVDMGMVSKVQESSTVNSAADADSVDEDSN